MDRRDRARVESYVRSHKATITAVCPFSYRKAFQAAEGENFSQAILKAYRILKKIGDEHCLLVVKPRECVSTGERERTAAGFIPRVGGLGPAKSRVEGSRIVPEFSPGAEKSKPRRRRKRVPYPPKSYIGHVMDDGSYEYGADHQPKDEPITE